MLFTSICQNYCVDVHGFLSSEVTMRRSGAPSQLLGNTVKKPRFVPPAASALCPVAESKPLNPKPGLGNALEKVNYSQFLTYSIIAHAPFIPNILHHCSLCQVIIYFNCYCAGPEEFGSTSSE